MYKRVIQYTTNIEKVEFLKKQGIFGKHGIFKNTEFL